MTQKLTDYLSHVAGDLSWVINSPYLTQEFPKPDFRNHPDTQKLITSISETPETILADLQLMKRHNLGTYFETLVYFWLRNLSGVTILTQNHQIQDGKQTLGELDVVFSYQNQIYHWELSVKFYACTGDPLQEKNWVGPLKKDTLARKLDRLFSHQLPLIDQYSQELDQVPQSNIRSYPFVKGMLFHQSDQTLADTLLPPRIHKNCLQARWYTSDEIDLALQQTTSHISVLPKRLWLSDPNVLEWQVLQSAAQLQDIVAASNRPQLVAFGNSKTATDKPLEISRHFIMTPQWLNSPVLVS